MKKIMYVMHIPWGWIKQRPHFIAELLGSYFKVDVYYKKTYRSSNLAMNRDKNIIATHELFALPFNSINCISEINAGLFSLQLRSRIKLYDFFWITHPEMYDAIGRYLPESVPLIYDCMDDALEFPHVVRDVNLRERIRHLEQHLINRSSIIFTSSQSLTNCLLGRYSVQKDIIVVNNGITINASNATGQFPQVLNRLDSVCSLKKIVYIGTISEWLDIDLILKSLDTVQGIAYFFIGPTERMLPKHDRIFHIGPIDHKYVHDAMGMADLLVMPFRINALVKSINPVKVYEYIGSGKPSLVVSYCETDKFEDYVYLYNNESEYLKLMQRLVTNALPPKRPIEECLDFITGHTWEQRIVKIIETIKPYLTN